MLREYTLKEFTCPSCDKLSYQCETGLGHELEEYDTNEDDKIVCPHCGFVSDLEEDD